mgnify:CR=1 FL=1
MLTSNAKEFTRAASILGIFTVGALIANYGSTTVRIAIADPAINVQSLLDGILPKLIPLLITCGLYALIKKGWTPIKCIVLILVAGIVGCAFGIWTGDSKAIDENGAGINGGYKPLVEWYEYPAPAAPETVIAFLKQFRSLTPRPVVHDFEALTRWWLDNPNPLTYQQALGMSDDLYHHFLSHPLISEDDALRLARKRLVTESEYNDLQHMVFQRPYNVLLVWSSGS